MGAAGGSASSWAGVKSSAGCQYGGRQTEHDLPSASPSASCSTTSSSLSISSSHLSSNSPISSSAAGSRAVAWPVAAALDTGRSAASAVRFPILRWLWWLGTMHEIF